MRKTKKLQFVSVWYRDRQNEIRPSYAQMSNLLLSTDNLSIRPRLYLTRTVESLAAMARISAQDTVSGHSFSNAVLISSTTSNPLAEFRFGLDFFSLVKVPVLSSKIDPSQPYRK